jgi:uncharacterized membrane protein
MIKKNRKEITQILDNAKWLIVIGVVIIIVMPLILTLPAFWKKLDFSNAGQIGDTIGGITAPFLNLIAAFLVFYALKAQVKANELIQEQIDKENNAKECENEAQNLNLLYSYLNNNIESFRFTTLPEYLLRNIEDIETEVEYFGGAAFFHLFSQIRCHFHGSQDNLRSNQSISELLSILQMTDMILVKLATSQSANKDILTTLVRHLFEYKVVTRIQDADEEKLKIKLCPTCKCNHGLPDDIRNLIVSIRKQLS